MSIYTAIFKYDGIEEEIDIETIELHDEFELVKKNLFCAFKSCSAQIEYRPKGINKAHFKTWQKQDHSPDCIDYFKREKKRRSEKGSATVDVSLSSKHINKVLKDLYREANESEDEKIKRLTKRREQAKKRKKKNPIVDESQMPESTVSINPTTENENNIEKGIRRAPNVKKRHNIQLLDDNDVNFTRAVYGTIKLISISEKQVIISLSAKKKICNVYFEESFFADAPQNMISMFRTVEKYLSMDTNLGISCIGKVFKMNNQFNLVVSNHNNFTLNGFPIAKFIFESSKRRF